MSQEDLQQALQQEKEARQKAELALEKARQRIMEKDAQLMDLHEQWQTEINSQSTQVEVLARIPEELSDPFFRIAANGTIQYMNPACKQQLVSLLPLSLGKQYPAIFTESIEKAILQEKLVTEEYKLGNQYFLVQFSAVPIPGYINVTARNVSEQKKIEKQLKASEKRFRQIIETASEIIYRLKEGKITYTNPIAPHITGYSSEALLQLDFRELIHPDYRQQVLAFYQAQQKQQTPNTYLEFPILTADKETVWLAQNAQLDTSGTQELTIVARNITDRKLAEDQLKLTSTRLETLISSMHTGVLLEDENRKIVLINERFIEIFGIEGSVQSLLGTDSRKLLQSLKKAFSNGVDFVLQTADILAARKTQLGEVIQTINSHILERDYVPIHNDDRFLGHLWQYRDVTDKYRNEKALKRSREALLETQEQAQLGSWELDVTTNELQWSAIMQKQFGLQPHEVPKDGVEFLQYFLPEDAEVLRENLMNAIGEDIKTFEVRIRRKDGSIRYLQMSIRLSFNERKAITFIYGTSLDVTTQRLMQEQLRKSEERFQLAMQGINDGIWDWNISEGSIYLSPRYKEIIGFQDHELASKLEAIKPHFKRGELRWLKGKVESIRPEDSPLIHRYFQMKHRDGYWLTIMMRAVVVFNPEGKAVRVVGANADVTDQVKAKEQLQRNYEAQRILGNLSFNFNINSEDYSQEIQASLEQLGRHTDVSRVYVFENSADNEFTSNTFEWCSGGVSEQIESLQGIPFSSIAEFKEMLLNEGGIICSDTSIFSGTVQELISKQGIKAILVFPILVKQEIRGFVGFDECREYRQWDESEIQLLRTYANLLSNVFERQEAEMMLQESEEKYRSLVENLNEVIFQTDDRLSITFLNPAWEMVSGYGLEVSLQTNLSDYIHADDKQEFEEIFPMLFEREADFYCQQFRLLTATGETCWIELFIRPTLDRYNQIDGFSGTFTDITERKNSEEELILAKETAEQASLAKARFLSIVSHEIRTPLHAVIGIAELLQHSNPRRDQEQNIGILKFSAENLLSLINDILDFNKIEAGKLTLEYTEFNLRELIGQLVKAQAFKAEEKGISLHYQIAKNIPDELIGDPTRLTQILHNLLSNAVKFTNKGMVQLNISLQQAQGKSNQLLFEVIDTGIGIPADKLDSIFEAFSQASANTTRLYGGTGLGLSITRRLIQLQGHDIAVESTEGEGSRFFFSLTYQRTLENSHQLPVLNEQSSTAGKKLQDLHILLAEDHPVNVLVASQYLEQLGVRISIAQNGLQAVEMAKSQLFDLIFMDLQMPEMDGYEASQEIRKYYSPDQLPIIAVSADVLEANLKKVARYGMNDYLSKPYSPEELYRKLSFYCQPDTSTPVAEEAVPKKKEPLFRLDKLKEDAGNNPEFIDRIISTFLKSTPPILAQLETAWKGNDVKSIQLLAHKLKPSIALLQVTSLKETLAYLEKAPDTLPELPKGKEHYFNLISTLATLIDELQENKKHSGS